jgi:hypothetical protein
MPLVSIAAISVGTNAIANANALANPGSFAGIAAIGIPITAYTHASKPVRVGVESGILLL